MKPKIPLTMMSLVDLVIATTTALADATDSLPRVKQILRRALDNNEVEDEAARALLKVISDDYEADNYPSAPLQAWHATPALLSAN
jgi:predicted outer membrane protein